jgi:phosphoribosyl 1,2-cyclic phosphate phosphodiesterase
LSVEESLAYLEQINPGQAYLTHLCHDIDHATLQATLPTHIHVGYDGLTLETD